VSLFRLLMIPTKGKVRPYYPALGRFKLRARKVTLGYIPCPSFTDFAINDPNKLASHQSLLNQVQPLRDFGHVLQPPDSNLHSHRSFCDRLMVR
jgi:hypothetical protein